MSPLYKRQLGKALYQAFLWVVIDCAVLDGQSVGFINNNNFDSITESGKEYINLYSVSIFLVCGVFIIGLAALFGLSKNVIEMFIEEISTTFRIALSVAAFLWLWVVAIGVRNNGLSVIYKDGHFNNLYVGFITYSILSYIIIIGLIPYLSSIFISIHSSTAPIPGPSTLDTVMGDPENRDGTPVMVPTAMKSSRAVRINITIPEDVLARIDAHAERQGMNRSGFLAYAAKREMESA